MQKITADFIHTHIGPVLQNTVLVLDDDGTILALEPIAQHDPASVQKLQGALVPGYINAHCHLELSHMKGVVDTGTGLVEFIRKVVSQRASEPEVIENAIRSADREMYHAGIVAVGDICNKTDTFHCKDSSSIIYYSFVEMFDFMRPDLAASTFTNYKKVYDAIKEHPGHLRRAVPHAPYSVSPDLFTRIKALNAEPGTISIHNQETPAETELFHYKRGGFVDLFADFGFPYDHFQATGKASIYYALQHLDPVHKHLFVHNTLTDTEDLEAAHQWSQEVYWVSCPNANLYIENRLPNYQLFLDARAKVCLGTDSLTSNWQLSIFEEMKTIKRYQSYVPTAELIRWATIHGAQALSLEDRLGTLEPGKRPGLNLITLNAQNEIDDQSTSRRIA
jgi:cytosine/adenosine deaminase-related metal-dependent hydrolase